MQETTQNPQVVPGEDGREDEKVKQKGLVPKGLWRLP